MLLCVRALLTVVVVQGCFAVVADIFFFLFVTILDLAVLAVLAGIYCVNACVFFCCCGTHINRKSHARRTSV